MNWQTRFQQGFGSSRALLDYLGLSDMTLSGDADRVFKTRVPLGFAARMEPRNPHDPLLLQVLAQDQEMQPHAGFEHDPLQEQQVNPIPGLIHKYPGRVLVTLTKSCAIHCRYCFRRHFPYERNNPGQSGYDQILHYILNNDSVHEVILSGGDPLMVPDKTLALFAQGLSRIPHVTTLRIHTRIPIVFPERIDAGLLATLKAITLKKVIVLHCNHPQEMDATVDHALVQLKKLGCDLLNQSVLLEGINDHVSVLAQLSERLFAAGVLPYYLHILDKVAGAAHFDVSESRARLIHQELQACLPGYLVPRLVSEVPGLKHKLMIG